MVARVLGRFADLVDDVLRCSLIGIAHAKVDDVFAGAAPGASELRHLRKNIRRQAV
jgi:hypothetical protein